MCGIFGIVIMKKNNIYDLVVNGLIQLQNRGYDSAGLAVIRNDLINVHKYASTDTCDALIKLKELTHLPIEEEINIGIGIVALIL